ncbi:DEAD-box ATP-dependent RNA helicase [Quillaja saponaria]|uniref:DEAD-box ATP-dependent RNA helicase n=1 Tax=Quillaja saponaria TaxID=32244 RepID=A0AAD7L386_QUISA|nr:DEAD-box ATP-dependent RNA helicase [Quillaja saponaria]
MNMSIPNLQQQLSFSRCLGSPSPGHLFLHCKLSHLSLFHNTTITPKTTVIRMGGGPRTYPGGVSKWQWKRMQAKKGKQLLKARLCRERQIYEMRKRAELKAAVSELERPWEVVERAPNLFSVKADEQLKVLADRFQKPGGFDLWSQRDGPQLFETPDELPSARFFPKGVVHSIKPYKRISESDELGGIQETLDSEVESVEVNREQGNQFMNTRHSSIRKLRVGSYGEEGASECNDLSTGKNGPDAGSSPKNSMELSTNIGRKGKKKNGMRKKENRRKLLSTDQHSSNGLNPRQLDFNKTQRRYDRIHDDYRGTTSNASWEQEDSDSEVYNMSLQKDGSYGF